MSSPRCGSLLASSLRTSAPHSAPASASGTLNQKTQCHEMATRAPPSTGPSTRPIAATIVFVPIARPSSSFGNASVTSAAAFAKRKAPDPLEDPPQNELGAADREARAERRQREDDEPGHVGVLATEEIRQPA